MARKQATIADRSNLETADQKNGRFSDTVCAATDQMQVTTLAETHNRGRFGYFSSLSNLSPIVVPTPAVGDHVGAVTS